jgi:UDP-N-acetylglucosamine 2-epimerase (non-hydrolysing)
MIDTLLSCRQRAETSPILQQLDLIDRGYAVLTLHRPAIFSRVMGAILTLADEVPVVFPVHPRTRKSLVRGERRNTRSSCSRSRWATSIS